MHLSQGQYLHASHLISLPVWAFHEVIERNEVNFEAGKEEDNETTRPSVEVIVITTSSADGAAAEFLIDLMTRLPNMQ